MDKFVDSCSVCVCYVSMPTTNSKENAAMNAMKKAWEIAKEAAAKFGGKASEFFAEALRMAWAIKKGGVMKKIIEQELEAARDVARKAYAEHGLSEEYENAMNVVHELSVKAAEKVDLSGWTCDSDGPWWESA